MPASDPAFEDTERLTAVLGSITKSSMAKAPEKANPTCVAPTVFAPPNKSVPDPPTGIDEEAPAPVKTTGRFVDPATTWLDAWVMGVLARLMTRTLTMSCISPAGANDHPITFEPDSHRSKVGLLDEPEETNAAVTPSTVWEVAFEEKSNVVIVAIEKVNMSYLGLPDQQYIIHS
ncbi:MAG: hypothetical protein AAF889_09690, partial [Cyanobacteria bacterium P01_D01_bin.73]